jgi:hypothetical protein
MRARARIWHGKGQPPMSPPTSARGDQEDPWTSSRRPRTAPASRRTLRGRPRAMPSHRTTTRTSFLRPPPPAPCGHHRPPRQPALGRQLHLPARPDPPPHRPGSPEPPPRQAAGPDPLPRRAARPDRPPRRRVRWRPAAWAVRRGRSPSRPALTPPGPPSRVRCGRMPPPCVPAPGRVGSPRSTATPHPAAALSSPPAARRGAAPLLSLPRQAPNRLS